MIPTDPSRGVFDAHAFADPGLLRQALTHRSAGAPNNERLEFLGDAVLGAIVSEALYARWPKADEGSLTRARAELVRESALATVARDAELSELMVAGEALDLAETTGAPPGPVLALLHHPDGGVGRVDVELERGLKKAGVATATHHLFICLGPDCCQTAEGEQLWEVIKARVSSSSEARLG